MIHRPRALFLAACLLALAPPPLLAQSDTVFVSAGLRIGIHEAPTLDSPVLELVPSGAAMTVIARDGAVVQVRLDDGREGWVDARYLSEDEPGQAQVLRLEAELQGVTAALADAEAQIVALEERVADQAEALSARPETEAPAPAAPADSPIPSETLREIQTLAEENQLLKQQVSELQAVQQMAVEKAQAAEQALARAQAGPATAQGPIGDGGGFSISRWERWQQILLVSALLLAFAAGGWLVDWGLRRRHGGFRV